MLKALYKYITLFFILIIFTGCASALMGGVASVGIATVQERSVKDAAIDLKLELQIQGALFKQDKDKLFTSIDIHVVEQRVLMIGNLETQELRDLAAKIAWEVSPKIKEVLNEITISKKTSLVSEAKDARISLSLSGLLIGDAAVSDINFSHSVSKQVIYLIGIALNDKELNKVIHHARTVKGAKKVVSHIILKNDKRRLN
jgi:osmotically-inducible protein OsmY